MSTTEIREPMQKRSIEKKEKIMKAGFDLICLQGYHNTNTAQIAKRAGVSTGIVYQYFKDKHDIFISSLEKYADSIFYPMLSLPEEHFEKSTFPKVLKKMIEEYIENHKLSQSAHEEIMSMIHSDEEVAHYFYQRELKITYEFADILKKNGVEKEGLNEKVHIVIGMIDNLCHEIVYHKHQELDYHQMMEIVMKSIVCILE